jgi:hypothetical protein
MSISADFPVAAHGRIQGRDRGRRADLEGGGQRRVLELPAQDGGHLERVPAGRRERGETLPDHLTHAAQRGAGRRAVREQLDAFRDEQRVASGTRVQAAGVDAVQARHGEPPRDAVLAQPGQVAPAAARGARQAGDHVGRQTGCRHLGIAPGDDHPDRGRPQRLAEVGEQAERGLIGPVQVVDDHQVRPVSGLVHQGPLDPVVQAEPGRRALRDAGRDSRPARPAEHLQPRP